MVCHLSSNTVASDTGCQWSNVVLCSYKAYNFLKSLNFVVPILGLGGLNADISQEKDEPIKYEPHLTYTY